MNQEISPINAKVYYELANIESIPNKALYKTFINWVSGEFELFLQDNLDGLQIFFPGGYCYITGTESNHDGIGFKIMVRSKYKQKGIQINNQVYAILGHVIKLKRPSIY